MHFTNPIYNADNNSYTADGIESSIIMNENIEPIYDKITLCTDNDNNDDSDYIDIDVTNNDIDI